MIASGTAKVIPPGTAKVIAALALITCTCVQYSEARAATALFGAPCAAGGVAHGSTEDDDGSIAGVGARRRRHRQAPSPRPRPRHRGRQLPQPIHQPPLSRQRKGGSKVILDQITQDHLGRPRRSTGTCSIRLSRAASITRSLWPSRGRSIWPSLDRGWESSRPPLAAFDLSTEVLRGCGIPAASLRALREPRRGIWAQVESRCLWRLRSMQRSDRGTRELVTAIPGQLLAEIQVEKRWRSANYSYESLRSIELRARKQSTCFARPHAWPRSRSEKRNMIKSPRRKDQ